MLDPAEPVALLDFPNHANAGDVLIHSGERAYLDELGIDVAYEASLETYDGQVLARRLPSGPILLHGGGNFGDRYAPYQEFRERIVAEHPDRRIIVLPQSMEYRSEENLQRTRSVYSRHPALTLLIRDAAMCERVRGHFPRNRVLYCPDLAFGHGPIRAPEPQIDVVVLRRTDSESAHRGGDVLAGLPEDTLEIDWGFDQFGEDLRWWPRALLVRWLNVPGVLRHRAHEFTARTFAKQTQVIVDNAVSKLAHGRVVVTDRLHAGVYRALMGRPVVMVDNANGKLSAAYRDYLHRFAVVSIASDFDDAARRAQEILSGT